MHSTAILLEKMGAKQWCWNGHSSTKPDKVYHNTLILTQIALYVHIAILQLGFVACMLRYRVIILIFLPRAHYTRCKSCMLLD